MRIFEITTENQILIILKQIDIKFIDRYRANIKILNDIKNLKKFENLPGMITTVNNLINMVVPLLDKFENEIQIFINEESFELDSDIDLQNQLETSKQQLAHIQQLRQELGI